MPDKDALYRQRHPERVKAACRAHYAKHREEINARRRAAYHLHRDEILAKAAADRVACPLCQGITFHRAYLTKHIQNRHKLDPGVVLASSSA